MTTSSYGILGEMCHIPLLAPAHMWAASSQHHYGKALQNLDVPCMDLGTHGYCRLFYLCFFA